MENKQQTPQLENGFIRIATGKEENDILMALIKADLNSTEYQIVLLVIRKTWGYGKKEDWISITQFMKYTGKGRTTIIEALNKLVRKSVLVRKSGRGIRSLYRLNKDFNTWNKLVRKTGLVRKTDKSSTENRTPLVRKSVLRTTKDNITKETITKDNINNEKDEIIQYFNQVMGKRFKTLPEANLEYWRSIYSIDEIKRAIDFIPTHDFWRDKMDLTILFRRKNPKGEPVDYIGQLLNTKKPTQQAQEGLSSFMNRIEKWRKLQVDKKV